MAKRVDNVLKGAKDMVYTKTLYHNYECIEVN